MRPDSRSTTYRRLARRNLAALLRHKFLYEYGYDKGTVVVDAIVADIVTTIHRYYRRDGDLEPGQLLYPAAAADERGGPGKTMAATRLVPVALTVTAEEDIDALAAGLPAKARRELRLRRLTTQAYRQGALLSQLDLALLLGCTTRTVGTHVRQLRQGPHQEVLPLRGYVADMGSWPTHKAVIIRLYLQGLTTPAIAGRTYHSKTNVDRYIRGFERVRLLAGTHPREQLPLLSGMSAGLVDQYLALLDEHGLRPKEVTSDASLSS